MIWGTQQAVPAMNCLLQQRYQPWVQSGPWSDVMRPLLSSSDKREEVAEKEENLGMKEMSAQLMTGEEKNVYFEHLELTCSCDVSPVHAEPVEMFFKTSPLLHCRISLTPQALPKANTSRTGTSLLTLEASPSEIAFTGAPVSMHLGYFRCLLQDGKS